MKAPHPERVREFLDQSLSFLMNQPLAPGSIRLAADEKAEPEHEVGLVIQFLGKDEGEIILLTSRATARALAGGLLRDERFAPDSPQEMKAIKNSLGELLNILASKLLREAAAKRRLKRVTTPSCIFGKGLAITPAGDVMSCVPIETPFGRLDICANLP